MNEEQNLSNLVAEIHAGIMQGLESEAVVAQLVDQGFEVDDAEKLTRLAICLSRIAVAGIDGREEPDSLAKLDSSGLRDGLRARLLEEATARFSNPKPVISEVDQFAIDTGLDPVGARDLYALSTAIVNDLDTGKTREAVIVRLEVSNYMPGEESGFVDHTLWAWETAKEIFASNGEISEELLASDPPWAVYTLLSFFTHLQHQGPIGPDFSTPEGALEALEAAYRTKDVELVAGCKDFVLESMFVLPAGPNIPQEVRDATITVLEAQFRDDMAGSPPEWNGIKASITGREELPGGMVILTEHLEFPSGDTNEMQVFVGKRDESWKVVAPYSDEMREAWLDHHTDS